jgi:hypothetical protein
MISNPQDLNYYLFLTYMHIAYIILPEIIIFKCYGVIATELTTSVPLYYCNNNITLKMAAIVAETYWWEFGEWNTSQNLKCILMVIYKL